MEQTAPPALMSFFPIIAMVAIFYFLMIRPQQKQAKAHSKMLSELKAGDRILTSGGIYGTITAVREQDLEVKLADNVKITMTRSAVASLLPH
ncbi:MAG: preprotein translocase subunit YajC [bacterium]